MRIAAPSISTTLKLGRHAAPLADRQRAGAHRIGLAVAERVGPGEGRVDVTGEHQVDLGARRSRAPRPSPPQTRAVIGPPIISVSGWWQATMRTHSAWRVFEPVDRGGDLAPGDLALRPVEPGLGAAGGVEAAHGEAAAQVGLRRRRADQRARSGGRA